MHKGIRKLKVIHSFIHSFQKLQAKHMQRSISRSKCYNHSEQSRLTHPQTCLFEALLFSTSGFLIDPLNLLIGFPRFEVVVPTQNASSSSQFLQNTVNPIYSDPEFLRYIDRIGYLRNSFRRNIKRYMCFQF